MKSKSQLKKIASRKRKQEHELIREKKEAEKRLKVAGFHPDQLKARKEIRESRRRYPVELEPIIKSGISHRETPYYPSVSTTNNNYVAERKESNKYTGDKLIGIAMMHKSNLIPIFNKDHAKDVSSMRRG